MSDPEHSAKFFTKNILHVIDMVNIMCCWEAVFVQWLSPVQTVTPWTAAHQFPPSWLESKGGLKPLIKQMTQILGDPIELTVYYPVLIPGLSENVNSNKLLLQPRPWLALWSHFQYYPFLMEFFCCCLVWQLGQAYHRFFFFFFLMKYACCIIRKS